jgi:iron(II)-dependent oxidoreductase
MLATRPGPDFAREILGRLQDSSSRTDGLFDLVRLDSLYERPIPERHRIVFYLGHLEAFDWNLLRDRLLGLKSFHQEFDQLFAFGIDPVGDGMPSDKPADWPSLEEVRHYVGRVRRAIDVELEAALSAAQAGGEQGFSASLLLNVAIEHRLMHAETLTYMLHQLPFERKAPRPRRPELVIPPAEPSMIEIPAGQAGLGLARGGGAFGWDNEYEAHAVAVPAFAIDQYKVTNRQFSEFIAAGGYAHRTLWNDSDWNWRSGGNITLPAFWRREGERCYYRTMFEDLLLPLDWPVYVSHAEASAYARWAGKTLPTEAQWHRACYGTSDWSERAYPWGPEAPSARLGNFDFHSWDPSPVDAFPEGRSAFGVAGMLGNGWEWTSSVFQPFPGFLPFPFYPGYSANFFDGKHYVIKGGSARTGACMLRRSFRNWFQPHYQYVYAGFRCVKNES